MPSLMLAPLLALVVLATGGGADKPPPYDAKTDHSTYDSTRQHSDWKLGDASEFNAEINLAGGRKVSMFYAKKRGLAEQHYSPKADAWTAPHIIYKTKTDPCQGIRLEKDHGTVAVIADWNLYCYDGEPPEESIAGVATGDLTRWHTNLTKGFDGWSSVTISHHGGTATWKHQHDRLTWTYGHGFDKLMGD